jgi:hypothetical protein
VFARAARALAVVTVSVASAFAANASSAPQQGTAVPWVGVQFHGTWSSYDDASRAVVLDRLRDAGVTWVRIDLGWASLQETSRGAHSQWYVDLADRAVDEARARGLKVLATLWATPSWANGGAGTGTPPSNPADYAAAAQWAAAHFRGRVSAWEVWNEPNLTEFWTGNVADYARLLKAAYPAIKAGDSSAQVVLGGPSTNDTPWLAQLYAAGAKGSFDVMATHPYQGMADAPPETPSDGNRWWLSNVTTVHDLMVANGDGAKSIWFTEFGWSSHDNPSGVQNWNRGVTPQQQADFLVRALTYVAQNFPYVTNVFWYEERNSASGNVQLDNYGLLNRDLSPKPAYDALKAFLRTNTASASAAPAAPAPAPAAPAPAPASPAPAASSDGSSGSPVRAAPVAPRPAVTPTKKQSAKKHEAQAGGSPSRSAKPKPRR